MAFPTATQANANGGVNRTNSNVNQSNVAQMLVPFERASKMHSEYGPQRATSLTTANQTIPFQVPVFGYLDTIYLRVDCVNAGNSAVVAFAADAPWNVFTQVLFRDVNGTPIFNLDGYSAFLAAKYGGYRLFRPEASAATFTTVPGNGATGGSFSLVLPIPVQFGRGAMGILPNMDASAQYQIELILNTLANIYSTPPNGTNTITISLDTDNWTNPPAIDQFGNSVQREPSNKGTTQYWSKQSFPLVTGENTILLSRVGNLIRNHVLVFRTTANARSDTVRPSRIQWEWDASLWKTDNVPAKLQSVQYRCYGWDYDTGLVTYPYVGDPDKVYVGEYGDDYVPTLGSTKLLLRFTPGAAGILDVLTNDIYPVGDIYAQSPPVVVN